MTAQPVKGLNELQQRLGVRFADPDLLAMALTHSSLKGEGETPFSNERLEFLGDAVLGMVVSEHLYRLQETWAEGALTRAKAAVVGRTALAEVARTWELTSVVRLSRGEDQTGGRVRPSLLADTVEALIGAYYIDQGLDACHALIVREFAQLIDAAEEHAGADDYKSILQERLQATYQEAPRYLVVSEDGPPHERLYHVVVTFRDEPIAAGEGRSKKIAEQAAAAAALTDMAALTVSIASNVCSEQSSTG